ncbi:MAG: transposase, partial [Clostridia bacterium]|nr:transposase [Clostridia bacterium]
MYDCRDESKNGEYHVILKFIDELRVFSQDYEKQFFIELLKDVNGKCGCDILNHVEMLGHSHIIIKVPSLEALASVMISINTRFAKFYNKMHNRRGRVFSKRYTSYPINTEKYMFTCFRYVSRNPEKAGIVKSAGDYKWSATGDYLAKNGPFYHKEIIERFNEYFKGAMFSFEEFIGDKSDDHCILDINRKLYYDSAARKIYDEELKLAGISELDPDGNPTATGNV